jgi:hypothetical protein
MPAILLLKAASCSAAQAKHPQATSQTALYHLPQLKQLAQATQPWKQQLLQRQQQLTPPPQSVAAQRQQQQVAGTCPAAAQLQAVSTNSVTA